MAEQTQYPESDPRHHTREIQRLLVELRDHCREDVGNEYDALGEDFEKKSTSFSARMALRRWWTR